MHDGNRSHVDVLAHDDGAGAFVHDDARSALRIYGHLFQFGDEFDGTSDVGLRHFDGDDGAVLGCGRRNHEIGILLVDGSGDQAGRSEVSVSQLQLHFGFGFKGRSKAFDERAFGDSADSWVIDHFGGSVSTGCEATSKHWSLGHCIDLAIGSFQRRHDEQAALQVGGIADGRSGDIHLHAGLREGGKRCGDEHGCCVFHCDGGRGDSDAHALQNVGQALSGEYGLLLVAGASKADDQAVAE